MALECYGNNVAFLHPVEIKFNVLYIQELLHAILVPAALAIIKTPGHSNCDSLEEKENRCGDIPARNAALKGTGSSQTSVMVQGDISS